MPFCLINGILASKADNDNYLYSRNSLSVKKEKEQKVFVLFVKTTKNAVTFCS